MADAILKTEGVDISPDEMSMSVVKSNCDYDIDKMALAIISLENALTASEKREQELEQRLLEIGDLAHDKSTGPAVTDGYWDIRGMAYELLRKLG